MLHVPQFFHGLAGPRLIVFSLLSVPHPRFIAVALVTSGLTCVAGCQKSQDPPPALTEERIEQLGLLPELQKTANADLAAEYAQIKAEGGTPAQLTPAHLLPPELSDTADPLVKHGRPSVPKENNVATALREVLRPDLLPLMMRKAEDLMPAGEFTFDRVAQARIIDFSRKNAAYREQFRQAMRRGEGDFEIRYTRGLFEDMPFLDAALVANRLEAFHAIDMLSQDKPLDALESVALMLRMAELLSRENSLATRRTGAELRRDALRVAQALVKHPSCSGQICTDLLGLIRSQLVLWPRDASMWIGERAIGLHTYEMVRDGHVMSLLSPEELQDLRSQKILEWFIAAAHDGCDADELFFLQVLRQMIEAADKPYFERLPELEKIADEMRELRNTPNYPIIADRVLLAQFQEAHAMQAEDRARCEAWALALAAIVDQLPAEIPVNPRTGQPYRVRQHTDHVSVSEIGPPYSDEPLILPMPRS